MSARSDSATPPTWSSEGPPEAAAVNLKSDITSAPVDRALVRLAGPAIVAKALYAVLGLVDVFWVGRLGAAPVAAVNTGFFTSWILQAATALTAAGILAHVARHIGAGNRARAGHAAAQGLALGAWLGALLGLVVWFTAPTLFDLLGTTDAVRAPGIDYLRILFLAAPLTFSWVNCEAVMRAAGNTRTPLLIITVMVLVNGVLDPLLIFGVGPFPQLGVFGAGLATAIAQAVAVLLFVTRAAARHPSFPLTNPTLLRIDWNLAPRILRIGIPVMAVGVLYSWIYLFLSGVAARLGTLELAVLGLGNRAETLTYLVSSGFGMATASVVGQNLGAGSPERASRAAWHSVLWMGAYGMLVGVVLVLWPREVLAVFTSDPGVLETGATYTRILGLCQGLMAIEIVLEHAFVGAGDTLPPMLISVPINVLRVPLVFALVYGFGAGIVSIAWLLSITAALRGVLAAAWFSRGRWKEKKL
jgi:putative MATE family efflux protein